MQPKTEPLSPEEQARFAKRGDHARLHPVRVTTLSEFVSATEIRGSFWYRGHADITWRLAPSALRYDEPDKINAAIELIDEFKRVAEFKLARPPETGEQLLWAQLAQHYGLPTRLLDWTESPVVALYFACMGDETDGLVFMLNPSDLNRVSALRSPRVLNVREDAKTIFEYLVLKAAKGSPRLKKTLAIRPVWNSDRIVAQKGAFTLHGTAFDLDKEQASSLVAIPILREYKRQLRNALEGFGIDEMTLFPELEHACAHLRRRAGL